MRYGRRCIIAICGLLALVPLAACGPASSNAASHVTLNVFAAASLDNAFTDIGKQFSKAHPGVSFAFNFAGSQQLAQQIIQGAGADVFASADSRQMQTVVAAGLVASGTTQVFVHNRLVVIVPVGNPAHLTTLADLARPGIRLVLAAHAVPVGNYSLQFLHSPATSAALGSGYAAAVLQNVVSYEEDVSAVLSKVELGEADAGIVYTSDVTPAASKMVTEIAIPDTLNVIASYPIAPVKGSPQAALASAFVAFVLSAQGQQTLRTWGFVPAAGGSTGG